VIDPAELGVAAQVLSVRYAQRQVRRSEVFHDYGSDGLPDATLDMDYDFWVIATPTASPWSTPATTWRRGTGWGRSR
jgi:hypothetical protein